MERTPLPHLHPTASPWPSMHAPGVHQLTVIMKHVHLPLSPLPVHPFLCATPTHPVPPKCVKAALPCRRRREHSRGLPVLWPRRDGGSRVTETGDGHGARGLVQQPQLPAASAPRPRTMGLLRTRRCSQRRRRPPRTCGSAPCTSSLMQLLRRQQHQQQADGQQRGRQAPAPAVTLGNSTCMRAGANFPLPLPYPPLGQPSLLMNQTHPACVHSSPPSAVVYVVGVLTRLPAWLTLLQVWAACCAAVLAVPRATAGHPAGACSGGHVLHAAL